MPDDSIIRATTTVDTSGLKAGGDEAVAITRQQLAILREQYRLASTDIRQSVNRIVDAEKQAAEATAASHATMASTLQGVANSERAALDGLIAKQTQLEASITSLKSALAGDTAAKVADTAATTALGAAHTRTVSEVQAASAAIRTFEGHLPIRAVERFAVSTLGLGPILQAAFPVVGAIALTEVLYKTIEGAFKLAESLDPVIQAEKRAVDEAEKLNREFEHLGKEFETNQIKIVELTKGKAAAQQQKEFYSKTDLALDAGRIKDIEREIKEAQDRVAAGTVKEQTPSLFPGFAKGPAAGTLSSDAKAALVDIQRLQDKLEAAQKQQQVDSQNIVIEKLKSDKDALEESKRSTREVVSAERKQAEDLKKADDDQFAGLQASHELTIAETISYWEKKISLERENVIREQEIHRQLGHLYQEKDKQQDRTQLADVNERLKAAADTGGAEAKLAALQSELQSDAQAFPKLYAALLQELPEVTKEATRAATERLKKFVDDEYEIWVTGGHRSNGAIIAWWEAQKSAYTTNAPIIEQATKKIAEATAKYREEQEKLVKLREEGAEAAQVGALQSEKLGVQRAASIDYSQTIQDKINEAAKIRDIDAQIDAVRIADEKKTLDAIAAAHGTEGIEYQTELNKIAALQRTADQQWYTETTKILAQQQAQYQKFWNTIQTGWSRMLDEIIAKQKNWVAVIGQIENQLLQSFLNMVTKRVIDWVEGTAAIQAAERAWSALMIALHLQTATGIGTIDKTVAVQSAAATQAATAAEGPAQVLSAAAVGAANAYAATAIIPFVGPELAPGVAAATLSAISAFAPLAAYDSGGYVPNTGIAMVHKGEGITSANLTSKIQNMTENQGGHYSFGDVHVHGGGNGQQIGNDVMSTIRSQARRNNISLPF